MTHMRYSYYLWEFTPKPQLGRYTLDEKHFDTWARAEYSLYVGHWDTWITFEISSVGWIGINDF